MSSLGHFARKWGRVSSIQGDRQIEEKLESPETWNEVLKAMIAVDEAL
jgi:hypothetical protein